MTLLYHFPLQETTAVSKVKGTKYTESVEGVLAAVGEITLESKDSSDQPLSDSSKPVTDGIDDIVETLADLELNVTLKNFQVLINYGISDYSISGTFKWVAYVSGDYSSYDGTSITLQSEKNDNPIFEFHENVSNVYQYIFHHSKKWYYAHKEGVALTNDSSNSAFWREITNTFNIESIFLPGIDTPFPALYSENGSVITWNHDIFRVENLLARHIQKLSGSLPNASFASFWAYINDSWTFVTFDSEGTVAFNNITQTDYSAIFDTISLNPFSLSTPSDQPLKILDLKFYNNTQTFQDIFKHPRNPSFGFFQLSHSSNIGIAGNHLDDSLAVFTHPSGSQGGQDQILANLRIKDIFVNGSASVGNLLVKQPKNDDDLWHVLSLQSSYTEHMYISTFNTSADNSLNFGQKGEDGVFSIWRYNIPDAQHTTSTFSVDTINNLTTINGDLTVTDSLTVGTTNIINAINTNVSNLQNSINTKVATTTYNGGIAHLQNQINGKQAAGNYQAAGSYASSGHNHDQQYQTRGNYAALSHNHDGRYAWASHTHPGIYTDSGRYLAASSNAHDRAYNTGRGYGFVTSENVHLVIGGSNSLFYGTGYYNSPSDDRLKTDEKLITDASCLLKLRPQIYNKYEKLDHSDTSHVESGIIAQEIWYDCPELRHLVHPGREASPDGGILTSVIPSEDPDYSSWGPEAASVDYLGLIPYLIRGFQEQHEENLALKARIVALEKAMGLSGNVETM